MCVTEGNNGLVVPPDNAGIVQTTGACEVNASAAMQGTLSGYQKLRINDPDGVCLVCACQ